MNSEDRAKMEKVLAENQENLERSDLALLKEAGVPVESDLAKVFETASRDTEKVPENLPSFGEILAALEEEGCHDIAIRLHQALVEKE